MINNISQSSVERVSLQSWRFAMSSAGGLLVSVAALPAVAWLGKGNIQNGYFYAMVLISSLGIILFYLCFFLTKETSIATIDANRGSLLQDLRILLKTGTGASSLRLTSSIWSRLSLKWGSLFTSVITFCDAAT